MWDAWIMSLDNIQWRKKNWLGALETPLYISYRSEDWFLRYKSSFRKFGSICYKKKVSCIHSNIVTSSISSFGLSYSCRTSSYPRDPNLHCRYIILNVRLRFRWKSRIRGESFSMHSLFSWWRQETVSVSNKARIDIFKIRLFLDCELRVLKNRANHKW